MRGGNNLQTVIESATKLTNTTEGHQIEITEVKDAVNGSRLRVRANVMDAIVIFQTVLNQHGVVTEFVQTPHEVMADAHIAIIPPESNASDPPYAQVA